MEMNESKALKLVYQELTHAQESYPRFNSMHEGYAVLLEEVDELWEEVKKKQPLRESYIIEKECIQIAAMAIRIILDCGSVGYRQ